LVAALSGFSANSARLKLVALLGEKQGQEKFDFHFAAMFMRVKRSAFMLPLDLAKWLRGPATPRICYPYRSAWNLYALLRSLVAAPQSLDCEKANWLTLKRLWRRA